jgi:hypothetical protein
MGLSGAILENCFTSVGSPKCQSTDGTQVGILDIADSMTCVYVNQMSFLSVISENCSTLNCEQEKVFTYFSCCIPPIIVVLLYI